MARPPQPVRTRAVVSLFDLNNEWIVSGHIPIPAAGYVDVIMWNDRVFKVETPERYREVVQVVTDTFVEIPLPT